ncbi:MAG: zinc-ribbon domain-containing protein [Anaerovoracaceae bacterium]
MNCQKCGSPLADDHQFCIQCGTQIQVDNLNSTVSMMNKASKTGKKILITIIVIAIVLVCIISSYFLLFSVPTVEGRYYDLNCEMLYMEFVAERGNSYNGNVAWYVNVGNDITDPLLSGTWKREKGDITTKIDDSEGEDTYILYKNHLVASTTIYLGSIPSGITFDATCTLQKEGGNNDFIFRKDGTFEQCVRGGEHAGLYKGTYTREDDIITCNFNDPTKTYSLLMYICPKGISASVYYKQE